MKRRLCFEDFAIHCMHPMELVTSPSHVSTRENTTSHVSTSSSTPVPQLGVSPPTTSIVHPHSRPSITKIFSTDAAGLLTAQDGAETGRPRAYTYSHKKEVLERIARKGWHTWYLFLGKLVNTKYGHSLLILKWFLWLQWCNHTRSCLSNSISSVRVKLSIWMKSIYLPLWVMSRGIIGLNWTRGLWKWDCNYR